jgi:hypothetical protein
MLQVSYTAFLDANFSRDPPPAAALTLLEMNTQLRGRAAPENGSPKVFAASIS